MHLGMTAAVRRVRLVPVHQAEQTATVAAVIFARGFGHLAFLIGPRPAGQHAAVFKPHDPIAVSGKKIRLSPGSQDKQ